MARPNSLASWLLVAVLIVLGGLGIVFQEHAHDEGRAAARLRILGGPDQPHEHDVPSGARKDVEIRGAVEPPIALNSPQEVSASHLAGRVTNEQGRPVQGARIQVWAVGGAMPNGSWVELPLLWMNALEGVDLARLPSAVTDDAGEWSLVIPPQFGAVAVEGPSRLIFVDKPGYTKRIVSWKRDTHVETVITDATVTIVGRVISAGGHGLGGVRVWAFEEARIPLSRAHVEGWSSVSTAADGTFRIEGLPAVETSLGFDGPVVPKYLELGPLSPGVVDLGEVRLDHGGSVIGVVVDEQGRGVADAEILVGAIDEGDFAETYPYPDFTWMAGARHEALTDEVLGRGRTDAQGEFAIMGLDREHVWISASAPGLETGVADVHLANGTGQALLLLPESRRVAVRVVRAEDGSVIDPAVVDVEAWAMLVAHPTDESLDQKRWWNVSAIDDGFALEVPDGNGVELAISTRARLPANVRVRPWDGIRVVPLALGAAISGHVIGAHNTVDVTVTASGGGHWRHGTIAEDGRYRIEGLPDAPLLVEATAAGMRCARRVEIVGGRSVDEFDLELQSLGSLLVRAETEFRFGTSMRVYGPHDLTISNIKARLMGTQEVQFDRLLPGTWTVSGDGIPSTPVEVVGGETTEAVLVQLSAPRISGRVIGLESVITTGKVTAVRDGIPCESATVQVDGSYVIELAESGDYDLIWQVPGFASSRGAVHAEWGSTAIHDLVSAGAAVEVVVIDELTREPLPGVWVTAITASHGDWRVARTDDNGVAHLNPLDPAVVVGIRIEDNGVNHPPVALSDVVERGAIQLSCQIQGSLELQVLDANGADVEFSHVIRLERTPGSEQLVREPDDLGQVPVGSWRVVAVPGWLDVETVPRGAGLLVEIRRGAATEATVTLRR